MVGVGMEFISGVVSLRSAWSSMGSSLMMSAFIIFLEQPRVIGELVCIEVPLLEVLRGRAMTGFWSLGMGL